MTKHDLSYQRFYEQAADWLTEFKNKELTSMIEFVEHAKAYLQAAEDLTQEEVSNFYSGLNRDLQNFYLKYEDETKNSVWLASINQNFWHSLAQLTDKSQVEWSELMADFEHNGVYCQGDLVGFGLMSCKKCKASFEIFSPSKLGACTECGHHQFIRYSLSP